eukprot:GILK01009787.1.p1 GENE.GILK01009787.1~~GILK01009787.1.p1  ORF type:complete len:1312 (+),score=250.87 GILK01009787.1:55-3990(+)
MNFYGSGYVEEEEADPYDMQYDDAGYQYDENGMLVAEPEYDYDEGEPAEMEPPPPGQWGEYTCLQDGDMHNNVDLPTATVFDAYEELVWCGMQNGFLKSYLIPNVQKNTSFRVDNGEVRDILVDMDNLVSISANNVRVQTRGGACKLQLSAEQRGRIVKDPQQPIRCGIYSGATRTHVNIGGQFNSLFVLDMTTERLVAEAAIPQGVEVMCCGKYLCAGGVNGLLMFMDPRTFRIESTADAHSCKVVSMALHENTLVTCGIYARAGQMYQDSFVKVFDLRSLRQQMPISFPSGATQLKFHPTQLNTLIILSSSGYLQMSEFNGDPTNTSMYQVETAAGPIQTFDISSSGESMFFTDAAGLLHHWADRPDCKVNASSRVTELPDNSKPPLWSVSIEEEFAPLCPYGLPLEAYKAPASTASFTLLSDWPTALTTVTRLPSRKISKKVLESLKKVDFVGYATNPDFKLNSVLYSSSESGAYEPILKNKGKKSKQKKFDRTLSDLDPSKRVPPEYSYVPIRTSNKKIFEEFDFSAYNLTEFAGLEHGIAHSYCNAILQMLYFISAVRVTMINHICQKEFCLSCELGFLFHMLDQARRSQRGATCQATNFLRSFRQIPETAALGLLDTTSDFSIIKRVESFNRFILQQLDKEWALTVSFNAKNPSRNATNRSPPMSASTSPAMLPSIAAFTLPTTPITLPTPPGTGFGRSLSGSLSGPVSVSSEPPSAVTAPDSSPSAKTEAVERANAMNALKIDAPSVSIVDLLFGATTLHRNTCLGRQHATIRQSRSLLVDLCYPNTDSVKPGSEKNSVANVATEDCTFADLMRESLRKETVTKGWCQECASNTLIKQERVVAECANIISINCGVSGPKEMKYWRRTSEVNSSADSTEVTVESSKNVPPPSSPSGKGSYFVPIPPARTSFIPLRFFMTQGSDQLLIQEIRDDDWTPAPGQVGVLYELTAVLSHVSESLSKDCPDEGHLVTHIKVPGRFRRAKSESESTQWQEEDEAASDWYLFNDFHITPTSRDDVVNLTPPWRTPSVLYYSRVDLEHIVLTPVETSPIQPEIFIRDRSIALPHNVTVPSFKRLNNNELQEFSRRSVLVALDAEFVALELEESEIREDGTKEVLKPSHLSLARVSVVRAEGSRAGEPFIDDYIVTQEPIVDYLTRFSGLVPGDLDPAMSRHHLTTKKTVYSKLRYLVDSGCRFIGHGLKQDFRIINIFIPPDQIIDTVDLYHLPGHRKISLRFLAAALLSSNIQLETHDSIEDARAALALYRRYEDLQRQGLFEQTLQEIYAAGRRTNWQIPEDGQPLLKPVTR